MAPPKSPGLYAALGEYIAVRRFSFHVSTRLITSSGLRSSRSLSWAASKASENALTSGTRSGWLLVRLLFSGKRTQMEALICRTNPSTLRMLLFVSLLIFFVISRYAAVYTNDFVKATNHRGMEISERF